MKNLHGSYKILLLAAFSIFSVHADAQHPQFEPAPVELKSKFENKQKRIGEELVGLRSSEWAGVYYAQLNPLDVALFQWSPSNGFVVRSGNDFHRGTEKLNYGGATLNGYHLSVTPELIRAEKHNYEIASTFAAIRWGQKHWLIPVDELMLFIYAVNSKDYEEIDAFFVKEDDVKKATIGLPQVPEEYRKYLNRKPIKAKATLVKNESTWNSTLKLNVGSAQGVIKGMKFYLIGVKDVLVKLQVDDVMERTSSAEIVSIGSSGPDNKEITPEIGWRFSSKIPNHY